MYWLRDLVSSECKQLFEEMHHISWALFNSVSMHVVESDS